MKRMMTYIIWMMTLFTGISTVQASSIPQNPETSFRAGVKKYEKGQYQEGVVLFKNALTNMPVPATFDLSLIHYNLGIGYYRLSQPDEAIRSFNEALRTPDIELQSKAYFNLGNTLYQKAQQALNDGDVATGFKTFQSAQTNFLQVMRLKSEDMDAKINFELCIVAQVKIMQMVAMAMSRLQQGDQMVGQHKFVEAAQWFKDNLPVVEKALSVEPDKKKLFQTMAERSSDVANIIVGPQGGIAP